LTGDPRSALRGSRLCPHDRCARYRNRYWPQMTYPVTPVSPVAPTLPVLPVAPVAPCGRVVGSTHRGAAAKGGRGDRSLGFLVTRPGWADPHGGPPCALLVLSHGRLEELSADRAVRKCVRVDVHVISA